MYEIKAEMHLSGQEDVWAYGRITINRCISFQIQMRKYKDKETGKERTFLSFPRRKTKNGWENAVRPSKELYQEIMESAVEEIKKEATKDFHIPDIENVEVTVIEPHGYQENAKAVICGLATVHVCGAAIHGITVKQGEKGLFINMPQYKAANGEYKDMVYGTFRAMHEKITQAVLKEYCAALKNKGGCL